MPMLTTHFQAVLVWSGRACLACCTAAKRLCADLHQGGAMQVLTPRISAPRHEIMGIAGR